MSEFWKTIEEAALPVLLTLIPLVGMALRAWLQSRTRRLESEGAAAWEHADRLSNSAPGMPEGVREQLAINALQRRGYSEERAQLVARRTRTEPIPLVPAPAEEELPANERPTLPGSPPPRH